MTYLYAGLGIAMLSGIAAMMQVGININSLIPLSGLKLDKYSNSYAFARCLWLYI